MKLLRIGEIGRERACVLDADGRARDVSGLVGDFGPDTAEGLIQRLSGIDLTTLPVIDPAGQRIGAPMAQPRNIYCIGLNYSDHAEEANLPLPKHPILFNKSSGTYCGPNDPILWSDKMTKLDWEVELAVVIGKPALNVSEAEALSHVLGYATANDVSERAWQMDFSGQWSKGKSYPNFCPVGPWLVTPDELGDAMSLDMALDVNGEPMQRGNTSKMVFDVAQIISHLSGFLRLEAGDIICTGTPPGVGMGKTPPIYLKPGDVVSLGIEGLSRQTQTVTRS